MFKKAIAVMIGATFFTGMISGVHANPLHPSYFANKAKAPMIIAGTSKAYVDSRNPLHPLFGRSGEWQTAATEKVAYYFDKRNPLHPSFRWN
jgi:hypothetical protein